VRRSRPLVVDQAGPYRMVLRGAVCRCPRCGSGGLFASWFKLRERCPGCGMRFEREEGFWLGGYVINFATGEAGLVVLLALLIGLVANGRHINAVLFISLGVAISVIGPILTFPSSRTVWSAIDLIMRPLSEEERVAAQAAVAEAALHADAEPVSGPPTRREADGP
jgi:uncharacterized protein (DUF983 family)